MRIALMLLAILGHGCAQDAAPNDDSPDYDGATLYAEPMDDGNSFACATCHALSEPASDGLRRPGHSLGDASGRPSYKNGQLESMLDAVNSCLDEWMNAPIWEATDPAWLALHEYLSQQHDGKDASALSFERVDPPSDPTGGDEDLGELVFHETCVVCHGEQGAGTRRAPGIAGRNYDVGYIARRVRTSGREDSAVYEDLTGGRMPFWSLDRLSETELLDVAAWVATSPAPTEESEASGDADAAVSSRDCASDHPTVGWIAILEEEFHDVAGRAEIVDDCTIVISDFVYDGTGIDVRLYAGLDGDYGDGFPVSGDLLNSDGYGGETLTASLPEDRSLDDLDGISVWCVDVGVDFGSGLFAPP